MKIILKENKLKSIIKETIEKIIIENKYEINEISKETSKNAYTKACNRLLNKPESERERSQRNNLYNHMKNKTMQDIDLDMPVVIVGVDRLGNNFSNILTVKDVLNNFKVKGYVEPSQNPKYINSPCIGYPIIDGFIGPMWDGDKLRYEDNEAYDFFSK